MSNKKFKTDKKVDWVKNNTADEILEDVKKYLYMKNDFKCPNCGNPIDSIIVGIGGIRCEFCRSRNVLENFNILGKVYPEDVVYVPLAQSISKGYMAEKDDDGNIVNSAAVHLHLPDDIFTGDVKEFFENSTGIVVIANKEKAKSVFPYLDKKVVRLSDDKDEHKES